MTNPNRSEVINLNFIQWVKSGNLPETHSSTTLQSSGMSKQMFMDVFETQMISRHLDLAARRLRARNLTFYTIGSSGHEGNAVHGTVFPYTDMAFLHYRSGAFLFNAQNKFPPSTLFTTPYSPYLHLRTIRYQKAGTKFSEVFRSTSHRKPRPSPRTFQKP